MDNLTKLKELQEETIGASFSLSYGVRKKQWSLYLTNCGVNFSGDTWNTAVQKAISYVQDTRSEISNIRYTLKDIDSQ